MAFIKQFISFIMILIFRPKKKDIDLQWFGVNAFFNQPSLGTMQEQADDISKTLGVKHIRILVQWNDHSQPSRLDEIKPDFSDAILKNISDDTQVIMVITGEPSWLFEIHDTERIRYFVRFCRKIMEHYKDDHRVVGYQIGNEPNNTDFTENRLLGFRNPDLYLQALAQAYKISKEIDSNKLILMAATTSIVQNYPDTLNYNKTLLENKVEKFCDVYCIHYYGDRNFINLMRPGGAFQFLKEIKNDIWVTEVGENVFNEHLDYARVMMPFLISKIPNIKRFYWYQYDGGGTTETFGLRNTTGAFSRLYAYLKNRLN